MNEMKLASITQSLRNTAVALAAAALMVTPQPAAAQMNGNTPERIEFSVDVAEDMNLYVESHVPAGTEPQRGSFFVTEGKIFPAGTIPVMGGDQFDPNAGAGSVGAWFCKGTFLVKGSVFDKTPMAVISDQMYLLPNDKQSIATTGTEGSAPTVRAVIGGTGAYAGYTGEQRQEFLGFNKTGGVNLRVTIILRKATNFR
jgi:hypothetical protein